MKKLTNQELIEKLNKINELICRLEKLVKDGSLSEKNEPQCNCPCIDCIEGNHCGEEYDLTEKMMGGDANKVLLHVKCEYLICDNLSGDELENESEGGL